MKLDQKKLKKNYVMYKKNYDKKTKEPLFNKGNKVLVMLPTNNNKALMQWKETYQKTLKIGNSNCT